MPPKKNKMIVASVSVYPVKDTKISRGVETKMRQANKAAIFPKNLLVKTYKSREAREKEKMEEKIAN